MDLSNYAGLQSAIADYSHRTDLTARIPGFIVLAEKRIKALLDAEFQDKRGTIATVAGQDYATLPSDLLSVKALSIANVAPALDYVTPDQLNADFYLGDSGAPRRYTTIGDRVYFGPVPDAVYSVSCTYMAEVPPLGAAPADVNSLLTKWPNVYLWGAMVEVAKFIKDMPAMQAYNADFAEAMAAVNLIEWHKGGPMTIRSDVRSV